MPVMRSSLCSAISLVSVPPCFACRSAARSMSICFCSLSTLRWSFASGVFRASARRCFSASRFAAARLFCSVLIICSMSPRRWLRLSAYFCTPSVTASAASLTRRPSDSAVMACLTRSVCFFRVASLILLMDCASSPFPFFRYSCSSASACALSASLRVAASPLCTCLFSSLRFFCVSSCWLPPASCSSCTENFTPGSSFATRILSSCPVYRITRRPASSALSIRSAGALSGASSATASSNPTTRCGLASKYEVGISFACWNSS